MNEKARFINPFTDFGRFAARFKKLFGTEFNKDLLIDFLNQVLNQREQIKDLSYLNAENQGRSNDDRKAIFDVYCKNEKGEKFIIEVQNVYQEFFKDRSIFYATFPIQEQAVKGGKWDYHLKAVYAVGLLNFSFPDSSDQNRYVREVQLMDTTTHEVFYDKLTFFYLEMSRFSKTEDELETHFDKWMYVLKNLHHLEEVPKKLRNRIFVKLFNQAEVANLTQEEMRAYEESQKVYWDNYSVMESAKKMARNEGAQENAYKVAQEMKKDGHPISMIAKYTKLTEEQIEKL